MGNGFIFFQMTSLHGSVFSAARAILTGSFQTTGILRLTLDIHSCVETRFSL